jgi:hypothetical protein
VAMNIVDLHSKPIIAAFLWMRILNFSSIIHPPFFSVRIICSGYFFLLFKTTDMKKQTACHWLPEM